VADNPEEEWKKAQEGWDAARRAAGAIPPLPQQNSTESFASDDTKRFLEAIRPLQQAAAEGALQAARERPERYFGKGGLREAIVGTPPSEKTTVSDTNAAPPMPSRDRQFWVTLAIWAAIPVGVFIAGVTAFVEGSPHWGFGLCASGLFGAYAVTLHLLEQKPYVPPNPSANLVGIAVLTWVFIGWQTWMWFHPPVQGYTQAQLDQALEEAKQKASAQTPPSPAQIATPKAQQLIDVQKSALQIGPQEALIISKYLGSPNNLPKDPHWAIFFTYPPENQRFYDTLLALIRDRLDPWILNAPDNSIDLDAPKFPPPPAESGITLHGDNALNTALSQILGPCFVVRRTDREIEGLSEWFTKRLSEPERAENRKITWIEIGQGSPWLQGNRLSTNCLQ
jgi:hypothetical protein